MSPTDPQDPFGMTVTNTARGDSILLIGVPATLAIAVINNTGADITLNSGSSVFAATLPTDFFTADQVKAITVTATGWIATFDATRPGITLTCSQAGTWRAGQTLTFSFENVTCSGAQGFPFVRLEPTDLGDNAPLQVDGQFAVQNPPKPGNLQLTDVLQVTLDSQGTVLRSVSGADPLSNTLYLTLKNISAAPLATGSQRSGNPHVLVAFVYGSTAGALCDAAYDRNKDKTARAVGSAWNITSGITSAPALLPWMALDPTYVDADHLPVWTLTPSGVNLQLLGPAGSDNANVTFSFSSVVSITQPGHTQMLVLCKDFKRDDQTAYDDHTFVLDIVKVDAPPTRGLLSFFGPDPVFPVSDPHSQITIPLRWAMFDVASVQLLSSSPSAPVQGKRYPVPPKPVDYDSTEVTVPAPATSEAIFFTLQAYDAGGGYLNSQQFTAYVQASYVIDTDGNVYTIALIGSTYWMLENYQLAAAGSYDYADNPGNEASFGRLYDTRVLAQPPAGWSVPTVADWNALFGALGDAKQAYAALTDGGKSKFNARLGGHRAMQPNGTALYEQMYKYGYYWAAGGKVCAQFSSLSLQASVGAPVPAGTALSVRFIRYA